MALCGSPSKPQHKHERKMPIARGALASRRICGARPKGVSENLSLARQSEVTIRHVRAHCRSASKPQHEQERKTAMATSVGQPAGLWSTTESDAEETLPLARQNELTMHVLVLCSAACRSGQRF